MKNKHITYQVGIITYPVSSGSFFTHQLAYLSIRLCLININAGLYGKYVFFWGEINKVYLSQCSETYEKLHKQLTSLVCFHQIYLTFDVKKYEQSIS